MPEFTVNPQRVDPYAAFKFQVVWDGRPVAGIHEISPLIRRTSVIEHRSGSDPSSLHRSPGLTGVRPDRAVPGRHARHRLRGLGRARRQLGGGGRRGRA